MVYVRIGDISPLSSEKQAGQRGRTAELPRAFAEMARRGQQRYSNKRSGARGKRREVIPI